MTFDCRITGDKRWEYENVLEFFKKSEDYFGQWDDRKTRMILHNHISFFVATLQQNITVTEDCWPFPNLLS
jgi:choline dehydrogenase-like flavoprotein